MPQVEEKIETTEKQEVDLNRPKKYVVLFMNDDFTPMNFVIDVLMKHFDYDMMQAGEIMMKVHTEGSSIIRVYPKDIAETKVECVMEEAKQQEFPFLALAIPEE